MCVVGCQDIRLRYCCIQMDGEALFAEHYEAWTIDLRASHSIDAEPCLVDPGHWDPNGTPDYPNDDFPVEGDYHLKSQAGRWDPNGASWVQDDVTSPCVDAGDPDTPIGYEPFPSGGVINMGAYGGTAEASKSYFGASVCETIIAGDINGDCRVDFKDFQIMALHWLQGNAPPDVRIVEPEEGDVIGIYQAGNPIRIRAEAGDIDGSVAKVEFFVEGPAHDPATWKIGEGTEGPGDWTVEWLWWSREEVYPEGRYTFTAQATDNTGAQVRSPGVTVSIHGPK